MTEKKKEEKKEETKGPFAPHRKDPKSLSIDDVALDEFAKFAHVDNQNQLHEEHLAGHTHAYTKLTQSDIFKQLPEYGKKLDDKQVNDVLVEYLFPLIEKILGHDIHTEQYKEMMKNGSFKDKANDDKIDEGARKSHLETLAANFLKLDKDSFNDMYKKMKKNKGLGALIDTYLGGHIRDREKGLLPGLMQELYFTNVATNELRNNPHALRKLIEKHKKEKKGIFKDYKIGDEGKFLQQSIEHVYGDVVGLANKRYLTGERQEDIGIYHKDFELDKKKEYEVKKKPAKEPEILKK